MSATTIKPSSSAGSEQKTAADPVAARLVRRMLIGLLVLSILLSGVAYGWRYWVFGRFIESTNDSFLSSDTVLIAPKVAGYLTEVVVHDNQRVKAGDVLVRIEDRDYVAALAQANAGVTESQAALQAMDGQAAEQRAAIAQADAAIEGDEAELGFSALERRRAASLNETGYGTTQDAQRTEAEMRKRVADLRRDQAASQAAQAKLATLGAERSYAEGALMKAKASLDHARYDLERTVVKAPVDGMVGNRTARAGNYVEPGLNLLTIVPMGRSLYVDANFKETQLSRMCEGQAVRFTVDAVGSHVFHGDVESFSPGTGSQFALLPPENATGNFTKIVQRVPVRIRLDGVDPFVARLRAGLSVDVSVDTRGAQD